MTKVHRTNFSKKMEIAEFIERDKQLAEEMMSFFKGDGDITLRQCYKHLFESKECAEVYQEKLNHNGLG